MPPVLNVQAKAKARSGILTIVLKPSVKARERFLSPTSGPGSSWTDARDPSMAAYRHASWSTTVPVMQLTMRPQRASKHIERSICVIPRRVACVRG